MLNRRPWPGKRALILAAGLPATALALAAPMPRPAASVATPATLVAMVGAAAPGATITLAPGDYGRILLHHKRFATPITLDARQARFESLILRRMSGVVVAGGAVSGPPTDMGMYVDGSDHITVRDMAFSTSVVGLSIRRSSDVLVERNRFEHMRSDGINVAMSWRVRIDGTLCQNFDPVHPTYDANGKLIKDGNHPDCIQGWSRPTDPPTSDITVTRTRAVGRMQGIFFNNYVRNGVDDGGYDRLTVRDNDLTVSMYHGILLQAVRGAVVTGNTVRPEPGARNLWAPFRLVSPWIKLLGSGIEACGNTVEAPLARKVSSGLGRCPK